MSSLKREAKPSAEVVAVARYTRSGVRSAQEVYAYLRRRGCSETSAQEIVARCRLSRAVDDQACARLLADHWARKGYAASAIRNRLAVKGLAHDTIQTALQELDSDDRERARAVVAQRTRAQTLPPPRDRLVRLLAARGFDADLIEQVLS